eukprot:641532-Prymnesium_polylepis.1
MEPARVDTSDEELATGERPAIARAARTRATAPRRGFLRPCVLPKLANWTHEEPVARSTPWH